VSSSNPYAPPKAAVADVVSPIESPPLWNPNAAASWSLVFSPVFGAVLHMKNWQAMGEPAKAAAARNWALASVAFFAVLILSTIALPESKVIDLLSRAGGLVLLLGWYYASGKAQNAAVLARYGKNYRRKGWAKPLLVALAAVVGFFVLAGAAGFLFGMLRG